MVDLRPAGAADARAVARISVESWQWAYAGLLPADLLAGLDVEARAKRWASILSEPKDGRTIVACRGPDVVGFTSFGPARDELEEPPVGEIWALYVQPSEAGKGTGYRLHEAAVEALRERNFARGVLWVLKGNVRAQAFYERQGWRADGAGKVDERPEGFVLHEIRLQRTL